jgi:DNA-binding LacI/PurR family transcriptional regulator
LYLQIRNLLAEKIRSGELQPGERLPPDPELAGCLGVNRLTLAKALNLLRRESYVNRYARKGTFVKERTDARAFAHGANAKLVAVLFDDATEATFQTKLFVAIHRALAGAGLTVKFLAAEDDAQIQFAQLRSLIHGGRVAGCIVWSVMATEQTRQILDTCPPLFPIVFLDRCFDGMGMDFSGYDDVHAGRLLARHLLQQGYRHVCVPEIADCLRVSPVRDRLDGLREEFAGVPALGAAAVHVHALQAAAAVPIRELAGEGRGRRAVVALDDTMAVRCVRAAREANVGIPDDLVVATFETRELCADPEYDLTAVRLPVEEMGRRAVEILVARLGGDTRPVFQVRSRGELVVRSSTDPLKKAQLAQTLTAKFGLMHSAKG